jgi:hypothetical protein
MKQELPSFVKKMIAEKIIELEEGRDETNIDWLYGFAEKKVLLTIAKDLIKQMHKEGRLVR